jgi:hypothetical protein
MNFPTVIPRTRTVTVGGERFQSERFDQEVQAQSLADIRAYMRQLVEDDTNEQIRLGNPPQLLEVDARTGKLLADIQRRAVVTFGTALPKAAMRIIEDALFDAIARTTDPVSGTLSNPSNWSWFYDDGGGRPVVVRSPDQIKAFGPRARLVLKPVGVPWAAVVNARVSKGGALSIVGKTSKKNPNARASKKNQKLGFMAWAARTVKKRPEFRQFSVYVAFTNRPIAKYGNQGMPMIVIRARSRLEQFTRGGRR